MQPSLNLRSGAACFAALLLLSAGAAFGQETAVPGEPPAEMPAPDIGGSTAQFAARVDEINAEVLGVLRKLQEFDDSVREIPAARQQLQEDFAALAAGIAGGEIGSLSLSDAESLQQTLLRMSKQLADWRTRLEARVDTLETERARLLDRQALLQDRLAESEQVDLPESLRERADGLVIQLSATRQVISARSGIVLEELAAISALELRIRDLNDALAGTLARESAELFTATEPPIWSALFAGEPLVGDIRRGIDNRRRSAAEFLKAREADFVGFLASLTVLLLFAAAWALRRRFLGKAAEPPAAERVFDRRPFAIAVLIWSVIGFELLLDPAPVAIGVFRVLIVGLALLRMVPVILGERVRPVVSALVLLGVAVVVIEAILDQAPLKRLLLALIGVVAIFGFRYLYRVLPGSVRTGRQVWLMVSRVTCSVAPYGLAAGVLALVLGLSALGSQLVAATLLLLMVLLGVLALEMVLLEIVGALVDAGSRHGFRSLAQAPEQVKSQLGLFVRLIMLALLISLLIDIFPAVDRGWSWLDAYLGTDLAVGTVRFSVYDVLVLLFSVAVAILVARVIRVLLNEDVLPRLSVRPGAAEAASRLVYYGLVTLGVLFALAAAGVELSRLTLVISALGVGIGFGLQSIVNNFVSGLILSFERPIQVGDTIVVGDLTGRVTQIGLRATRIRTFDAAEVIVPNADLISSNVVNWTLSDRTRRLDLPVFVAYGSDLDRVREALLGVAARHPAIAAAPAPELLFQAYGDSALELWLRVWMPDSGNWPTVRSELYYMIDEALRSAGIDVPYPHRVVRFERDGKLSTAGLPTDD